MVMAYGYAGMRDYGGRISFSPRLPRRFPGGRFCLTVRGNLLEVDMTADTVLYALKEGDAFTIYHEGDEILLTKEAPTALRNLNRESGDADVH